jgi:hypothetical protein
MGQADTLDGLDEVPRGDSPAEGRRTRWPGAIGGAPRAGTASKHQLGVRVTDDERAAWERAAEGAPSRTGSGTPATPLRRNGSPFEAQAMNRPANPQVEIASGLGTFISLVLFYILASGLSRGGASRNRLRLALAISGGHPEPPAGCYRSAQDMGDIGRG